MLWSFHLHHAMFPSENLILLSIPPVDDDAGSRCYLHMAGAATSADEGLARRGGIVLLALMMDLVDAALHAPPLRVLLLAMH